MLFAYNIPIYSFQIDHFAKLGVHMFDATIKYISSHCAAIT